MVYAVHQRLYQINPVPCRKEKLRLNDQSQAPATAGACAQKHASRVVESVVEKNLITGPGGAIGDPLVGDPRVEMEQTDMQWRFHGFL